MRSNLRHRHRTFTFGLLLLVSLIVQPLLGVASETHETLHLLSEGHMHEAGAPAQGETGVERPPEEGAAVLHALLHQGHCCMHGPAIVMDWVHSLPVLAPPLTGAKIRTALARHYRSPNLRPPIQF